MRKKWTRRKFLETGFKGSIVAGGTTLIATARPQQSSAAPSQQPAAGAVKDSQRALLRTAMDEIIPATDGMPSASQAGGMEYLERLTREDPKIAKEIERSLAALGEITRSQFGKDFATLSHTNRVAALKNMEAQQSAALGTLRDYVYESYYTQPKVWKLIGYEFYPTNGAGPHMKPFDEAALDKVKKMPKLYREAP